MNVMSASPTHLYTHAIGLSTHYYRARHVGGPIAVLRARVQQQKQVTGALAGRPCGRSISYTVRIIRSQMHIFM
jgi:hypothetical protein